MRKFLSVLIGAVILAAAALLLWMARGPLPKQEVTTGGVLTTQQELAGQAAPDLGVITDEGPSSTNIIGRAEIAESVLSDTAVLEDAEIAEAPPTMLRAQGAEAAAIEAVPLTTDVQLRDDTEVAVAPLEAAPDLAPLSEGQGGPIITQTYEQRVVEFEWPTEFRVGGSGVVRVKLKVLEDGALQPVAEIADNEVVATPIMITDRYDTYDATVTAMISAPNFDVEALSAPTQTLTRGGETEWRWTLDANESGDTVIAVSISIAWFSKADGSPGPSTTIWGQSVQADVGYVLGVISVPQASIAGTVLAVIGFVAEIPFFDWFLERLWGLFFGRRRRRRKDNRRR